MILKDSPILVLDEATSALDSRVETAIQSQLGSLTEGKTVIAIAHRLSNVAALDRLIVLDNGRIVEGAATLCCFATMAFMPASGPASPAASLGSTKKLSAQRG